MNCPPGFPLTPHHAEAPPGVIVFNRDLSVPWAELYEPDAVMAESLIEPISGDVLSQPETPTIIVCRVKT